MEFKIIVDDREKKPLEFSNSAVKRLRYGDYSLDGYEHRIQLERKSLPDFVKSIVGERRLRFESNIRHATQELKYYAILIECNYADLSNSANWHSKVSSACVKGTLKWAVKHHVAIFFCSNREGCKEMVENLLIGFTYYHKDTPTAARNDVFTTEMGTAVL